VTDSTSPLFVPVLPDQAAQSESELQAGLTQLASLLNEGNLPNYAVTRLLLQHRIREAEARGWSRDRIALSLGISRHRKGGPAGRQCRTRSG